MKSAITPAMTVNSIQLSKPGTEAMGHGVVVVSIAIPDNDIVENGLMMHDIKVEAISVTVPSRYGRHCRIKFAPQVDMNMLQGEQADSFPPVQGFQGAWTEEARFDRTEKG